MSEPGKAVFLSYASQDAEAARLICEALRAAGVEVWFDQSELRGGEEWDASIRKQIRECALFVPVISAATQARPKGYFRREWKLAVECMQDLADGVPFLVPVALDDTRGDAALVPEVFLKVQWTRAPGGQVPLQFVARVGKLLAPHVSPTSPSLERVRPDPESKSVEGFARHGMPQEKRQSPDADRFPALHPSPWRRWVWAGWAGSLLLVGSYFVWKPPTTGVRPAAATPATANAPTAAQLSSEKSIAVLPFESLSSESDNLGFADSMHEEVISAVGKVSALTVIGRTSVLPYRDPTQRNFRRIAADLNIGSIVEGSVRRVGNRVRITVKLSDAQSSRQLWSDSFEQEMTDVFTIQANIAQEVATTLRATLTPGERATLKRRPTENARAYELYLQAKVLTNELTPATLISEWERAIKLLEDAVAADAGFAKAYALLARNNAGMYWYGGLDPSVARRERAEGALSAAKALAPSDADTRYAEGRIAYACRLDFAEAMRLYQAAILDLPNDSALFGDLGLTYRQLDQHAEAIRAMTRSHALNPLNVENANNLAGELLMVRRFADLSRIGARYNGPNSEYSNIARNTAVARFELDGDVQKFIAALGSRPSAGYDPYGLALAYEVAWFSGNLNESARILADSRFTGYFGVGSAILDPIPLHRAMVALLQGDQPRATEQAEQAIKILTARPWPARQQLLVRMLQIRASAYGGAKVEAVELASKLRAELEGRLGVDQRGVLNELGRLCAVMGARDEAFRCLRILMTGPNASPFGTPRVVRIDLCWSKLADDPRFEEILDSAKSL